MPAFSNGAATDDMETVPGEFDADDMIVMDGVTMDANDDATIEHHYMMAGAETIGNEEDDEAQNEFAEIRSGGDQIVDVDGDVDEMIKYQDGSEETTSQFQRRVNGQDD